jgi:hypothetical protein
MADVGGGITQQQAQDMIAAAIAGLPTSFVNNGAAQSVASLLTNYPAGAANLYKYARVNDLWGNTNSIMICEAEGSTYYWRPTRTDYASASSAQSGTVTLTPLVTPPTLYLTGALTSNLTVNMSATNAWPGAQFEVISTGVLNLFGITLGGLIAGGTVPILQGARKLVTYTTSGWRAG